MIWIWVWYAISNLALFYVIYQVNYGKTMTKREMVFFFLGMFIMGVPAVHLLVQQAG